MSPLTNLNGNGKMLLAVQAAVLIITLVGAIIEDALGLDGSTWLADLAKIMVGALFGTGAAVTITNRQAQK